ncbi:MAG TPA: hypothetical protein VFR64_18525 [Methylomirabilota bacterium]|nr:hypothetical protein [Methylomirabilota bacterium]
MLAGILALVLLLAACAGPASEEAAPPAPDFTPAQIRQPAVVLRFVVDSGDFGAQERLSLPVAYAGLLLEALDARAVPARDAQQVSRIDRLAAAMRARDVGADHALLVDVRVEKVETYFCRDGRRPFRAPVTTWIQAVEVVRASDAVSRMTVSGPALTVIDLEPDCESPRESRRRSSSETAREGVNRLLKRLLEP